MARILTIMVMLISFSGMGIGAENIPSAAATQSIHLYAINTGWILKIRANGSAVLTYGSNPFDMAEGPAGTFSLQEIYNSLVPKLSKKREKGDIAVAVRAVGTTSVKARYVNAAETMQLFQKAQKQCKAINKARMDALYREYPIEPITPQLNED